MTQPLRVLLLEMPQLLRNILEHAVQVHRDCELVRDTRWTFAMSLEPALAPYIVILGLTAAEDASLVPALFARWPQAQVMTVMQAGDDAAVYELRPRRRSLGQMSPQEVVDALCDSVRRKRDVEQQVDDAGGS